MWRQMTDGRVRYVRVSGEALFNADGSFAGYRGVGRDVTEEKRAEQMLRLEHDGGAPARRRRRRGRRLAGVMRAVCEAEGFACGRYFRVDGELLRFQDAWAIGRPDDRAVHRALARLRVPRRRRPDRHRVSERRAGVVDRHRARSARARPQPGRAPACAAASPSRCWRRAVRIGVLNFSSLKAREPDERLLQAARVIGSQIGQFLQRKQAEASLRDSEARFRSLTPDVVRLLLGNRRRSTAGSQLAHGPGLPADGDEPRHHRPGAWELPYDRAPTTPVWAAHRARLDQHAPFRDFEFAPAACPTACVRYLSISGEPRFAADGGFLGYRGVGRDVTEIALARERIATLAYSDPLTGLANRTSLGPSLEQAVQRAPAQARSWR